MSRQFSFTGAIVLLAALSGCGKKSDLPERELMLFRDDYHGHAAANKWRSPQGIEDLAAHHEKFPKVAEKIRAGGFVVIWDAKFFHDGTDNQSVLGYEKDAEDKGGVVLMAGGAVRAVSADEFRKLPRIAVRGADPMETDADPAKEPPVLVEASDVPPAKGAEKWQVRIKTTGDPIYDVQVKYVVWQNGKPGAELDAVASLATWASGEITLSIEPKGKLLQFHGEIVNRNPKGLAMGSSQLGPPPGPIQGGIVLKDRLEAKTGKHAVWALTAGKQAEKKPDETPEETAKRSEWAMVVAVSIQRRQDTHGVRLTMKPAPGVFYSTFNFTGPSWKKALEDWKNVASPDNMAALPKNVIVDPKDPKRGSAEFIVNKVRAGVLLKVPGNRHV